MSNRCLLTQLVALILVVCITSNNCYASIDRTPVKVTNRNSGPVYDLAEDVERIKIPADSEEIPSSDERRREFGSNFPRFAGPGSPNMDRPTSEMSPVTPDIGRISIRRIFIVPVVPSPSDGENNNNNDEKPVGSQSSFNPFESMLPFMMMRPTLAGPGPQADASEQTVPSERRHLFGSDWASRSPFSASEQQPPRFPGTGEREELGKSPSDQEANQLTPDPFQLLKIMLRTFAEAQNHVVSQSDNDAKINNTDTQKPNDLEKSASDNEKRDQTPLSNPFEGLFGKPKKATSQNETREDIVEIEGKKYLRKTVLNRHVGENMMFVTRRLIFVPYNETEPIPTSTNSAPTDNSIPTTTLSPSTTTKVEQNDASPTITPITTTSSATANPVETKNEQTTTTTSTTTTTTPTTTTTIVDSTTEKAKEAVEEKP